MGLLGCVVAVCVLLSAGVAAGARDSGETVSVPETRVSRAAAATPIGRIQGRGHISPFRGRQVNTTGVVTAVDTDGFYLQDPVGDGDPDTSDGIFVFTRKPPAVAAGDEIRVRGVVTEFQPGGAKTGNLTITQITRPRITRLSRRNRLPAPVVLGAGGRVPPNRIIDNDGFAVFDPEEDGIDFYETLEGMRVTVRDAVAVSPTSRFGEIFVRARNTSPSGLGRRGTLTISPGDFNPERIQVDDDFGLSPTATPHVKVGDSLGDVTGVMSYGFGSYEVRFTEAFSPRRGPLKPETTRLEPGEGNLTIASFNVLNLDPNDRDGDTDVAAGRFDAVASVIVRNLHHPDIVALQEVQDNDGSAKTRVKVADATLRLLVGRIAALGSGPLPFHRSSVHRRRHQWRPTRREHPRGFPLQSGAAWSSFRARLPQSPTRADQRTNPRNSFFNGRLPLIAGFPIPRSGPRSRDRGQQPFQLQARQQSAGRRKFSPPRSFRKSPRVNSGVDHRRRQARAVHDFVANRLAARGDAHIVVAGRLQRVRVRLPAEDPRAEPLHNLTNGNCLPNERYTYIFEGNAQSLDHTLVSRLASSALAEVDIVHVNAEFAETAARASDTTRSWPG